MLTPEQVKTKFREQGTTFTEWAKQHGFKRHAVYRVLNGFDKAHYGQAHRIAVALGMKQDQAHPSRIAA